MDDAVFMEAFLELCKEHGVVDFALVARTVDGESLFQWFAGQEDLTDGGNTVSNRERAANLHFDLTGLAANILQKNFMPAQAAGE